MTESGWALQKSVYGALASDAAVTALLGGTNIFDDVPRDTGFPYVTFGASVERDWSTGTEEGSEHLVSLHVWSRESGRKEVLEIVAALRSVLHDEALVVGGNHLVNFRHEFSSARREPDGETYHGIVRFRGVLELVP